MEVRPLKRTSKLVAILVAALCLLAVLCGCSSGGYTPEKKQQTVSDSMLVKSGTLTVGVNSNNAPYSAQSSGSIVGIDVDVAAALADELGLKLDLVDVGTDIDSAISGGTCDIVMGASSAGSSYAITSTYRTSGAAVFATDASAQLPTKSSKIAAQASSLSAWKVSDVYGKKALVESNDLTEAFTDIQNGTANYAASDSTIGAYVAHTTGVSVYPICLLEKATSYGVAVSTTKTDLQTSVETALSQLNSGGMIKVINNRWVGETTDVSSLKVAK